MTSQDDLRPLAVAAILMLRSRVRWKPGKDIQHLRRNFIYLGKMSEMIP